MIKSHSDFVTITKADIKRLRNADSLCFDLHNNDNPVSQIRAIYRRDTTYVIPVGYTLTSYATTYSMDNLRIGRCFEMFHSIKYDNVLGTVLSLLRDGDGIRIHWVADNNSQIITDAGLHHDEIHIQVRRNDKTLEFMVSARVSPDNSARSVQIYDAVSM